MYAITVRQFPFLQIVNDLHFSLKCSAAICSTWLFLTSTVDWAGGEGKEALQRSSVTPLVFTAVPQVSHGHRDLSSTEGNETQLPGASLALLGDPGGSMSSSVQALHG